MPSAEVHGLITQFVRCLQAYNKNAPGPVTEYVEAAQRALHAHLPLVNDACQKAKAELARIEADLPRFAAGAPGYVTLATYEQVLTRGCMPRNQISRMLSNDVTRCVTQYLDRAVKVPDAGFATILRESHLQFSHCVRSVYAVAAKSASEKKQQQKREEHYRALRRLVLFGVMGTVADGYHYVRDIDVDLSRTSVAIGYTAATYALKALV